MQELGAVRIARKLITKFVFWSNRITGFKFSTGLPSTSPGVPHVEPKSSETDVRIADLVAVVARLDCHATTHNPLPYATEGKTSVSVLATFTEEGVLQESPDSEMFHTEPLCKGT